MRYCIIQIIQWEGETDDHALRYRRDPPGDEYRGADTRLPCDPEYLAGKNCIPLIASHDKELTVLLEKLYDNYHFSEEMGEDDISFSYKIMRGPATSQNAVKLLKLAGFPEEILEKCEETDETLEKSKISC